LSSPIVCRVTEIVNQPFPSKVHALTGRVNRPNRKLRETSDGRRFTPILLKPRYLLPYPLWILLPLPRS
jgi:hypothetical protein